MATSRQKGIKTPFKKEPAKKGGKKPVRFVKSSTASSKTSKGPQRTASSRTTTTRKAKSKRATAGKAPVRGSVESKKTKRQSGVLSSPGWKDLAKANDRPSGPQPDSDSYLGALSTARFAAMVLAVATLFTLYVGHVFAMQDLLADVQNLRNENLALEMTFDKLEGDFHSKIGPEAMFGEAAQLGLSERLPTGTPIIID